MESCTCLVLELFIGLQEKIYFAQPLEIIKVWKVGMSFHGGLIGEIFKTSDLEIISYFCIWDNG